MPWLNINGEGVGLASMFFPHSYYNFYSQT